MRRHIGHHRGGDVLLVAAGGLIGSRPARSWPEPMIGGRSAVRTYHRAMATDARIERPAAHAGQLAHGTLAIAGLVGTAGFIHLIAMIEHLGVEWTLALFFAGVGVAQLAAGWWIFRDADDTRLLVVAAAGSVVIALLWLFSRTTGLSFGPEQGRRAVGVGDTVSSLLEGMFAGLVALRLRRGEQRLAWLSSGMGIRLTFMVLSLALMLAALGGHEH